MGDQAILVDTNVILDVVGRDPNWWKWSVDQLEQAAMRGRLLINPVVYTEFSIAFERIEEVDRVVQQFRLRVEETPKEALFLAGKVYLQYRKNKGTKSAPLPDFFIGAHAAVKGVPLLTRDVARYQSYFPTVRLITPDAH